MQEIKNLEQDTYRQLPAISVSDIKLALENPYLYKTRWSRPKTDNMILGSVVHALVIEPEKFNKYYFVLPKLDLRNKYDKEKLQQIQLENPNKNLIKEEIYNQAKEISNSILTSDIGKLFRGGFGEASYIKDCYGVKCKVRPDYYLKEKNIIIDLKTTMFGGANPNTFQKTIAKFKYYMQARFYLDVLKAEKFFFVAVEVEEPYMIGLFELDNVALDLGLDKIMKGIDIIKNIDKYDNLYLNNDFDRLHTLNLPAYEFYDR